MSEGAAVQGAGKKEKMLTLTLYTKRNCPLCDEAKEMLRELQEENHVPFQFAEVDIMMDMYVYDTYKDEVPVISFNDEKLCFGKIKKDALRRCIHEKWETVV